MSFRPNDDLENLRIALECDPDVMENLSIQEVFQELQAFEVYPRYSKLLKLKNPKGFDDCVDDMLIKTTRHFFLTETKPVNTKRQKKHKIQEQKKVDVSKKKGGVNRDIHR